MFLSVRRRRVLIALFCMLLGHTVNAEPRVIWLMLDGALQRSGGAASAPRTTESPSPGEQARLWMLERLSGFGHETMTAAVARIEKQVEDGGASGVTYCYANALRTPKRETYAIFSEPVLHRLPARLIVRADRANLLQPHLNAQGQVMLKSVVKDPALTGAVTQLQSYGPLIDPILAATDAPHRVANSAVPARMLMARRIDWLIASPADLAWFLHHEPDSPRTPTQSFEFAGPADSVVSYVMCNRTATGLQLIETLNRLMAKHPGRPWERAYLELLDARERSDLARLLRASKH